MDSRSMETLRPNRSGAQPLSSQSCGKLFAPGTKQTFWFPAKVSAFDVRIQPVNATQTPIPLCWGLGPPCEANP